MKAANQHFSTRAGFKPIRSILSKWVRTHFDKIGQVGLKLEGPAQVLTEQGRAEG